MDNKLLDLSGKVAIVTGGAAGIGYGISYRLAEARARVVIANRTARDASNAVLKLKKKGFKATAINTDVSMEESVKHLVEQTVKEFGHVDILVNNAGIYPTIPLVNMTLLDFERVLAVNLNGVFLCTKYVSEHMIKRGEGNKHNQHRRAASVVCGPRALRRFKARRLGLHQEHSS